MNELRPDAVHVRSPDAFFDRELSWLAFARRVLERVEDAGLPLLERVKFAGIMGMLHDEFFMKRVSGLKRAVRQRSSKRSLDGSSPERTLERCREEVRAQASLLARALREEVLPGLAEAGMPIAAHDRLGEAERERLREYFRRFVQPILTPLAVDAAHPFPFISNDALNLLVQLSREGERRPRYVRIKVPDNRPRWVPLSDGAGVVPMEQVIRANLDLMFPSATADRVQLFRVTRGAQGDVPQLGELTGVELSRPGSIVRQVSAELKARRFAGVVRVQLEADSPADVTAWLSEQLGVSEEDVDLTHNLLRVRDLLDLDLDPVGREQLRLPRHDPVVHSRLRGLPRKDSGAIFREIRRGDILLHHPYDDFDSSVLRFLESAATDPAVLAIKLTIYRTSKGSPIVTALAEAARRGKQVAVLVEITARFDEAPNIAWGRHLENEGVHVAYGVEKLKTHVKLALVVREEGGRLRRYAHVGTGNYHAGTARIYEDLGLLTCHPEICEEVSAIFNQLTGASQPADFQHFLVAPWTMRRRFTELIRREAGHARAGRPSGIRAKMNQLQDPDVIGELYEASRAGVPIELNVRGLCCLRPGVPGLSESIRVFGVVGRFLEHSRIYRFENGGAAEHFLGSADWMSRNLNKRVETVVPVLDPEVQHQLDAILDVYGADNCSASDCRPDGTYLRRSPAPGEPPLASQEAFIELTSGSPEQRPWRPEDVGVARFEVAQGG
jgi:polyphosphate kinase